MPYLLRHSRRRQTELLSQVFTSAATGSEFERQQQSIVQLEFCSPYFSTGFSDMGPDMPVCLNERGQLSHHFVKLLSSESRDSEKRSVALWQRL